MSDPTPTQPGTPQPSNPGYVGDGPLPPRPETIAGDSKPSDNSKKPGQADQPGTHQPGHTPSDPAKQAPGKSDAAQVQHTLPPGPAKR
jgi:hypothetical protein